MIFLTYDLAPLISLQNWDVIADESLRSGLIAWLVPCVTIGQNAEGAGVTDCLIGGVLAIIPIVNLILEFKIREKIRKKYNLEVSSVE